MRSSPLSVRTVQPYLQEGAVLTGQPRPRYPVLVVDDDDEERSGITALLERADYPVLQAATGEAGVECARWEDLSLVLLDICLPGISGYQVCTELKERHGDGLPIMFVTGARTESYDRVACFLVGGDDYLAKPVAPDELLIRVARLIRLTRPIARSVVAQLTPRELQVLRLVADGLSPTQVADSLVISRKTVATHIDHILSKLGVHSRAQAVAVAFQTDVLVPPTLGAAG